MRFALDSGGGLRFLRWFARIISFAGLWPTWYAWWGRPNFDAESLLVGAVLVPSGLGLWWWSGYRLRNPVEYVEIDAHAGVARLQRNHHAVEIRPLDALGPWALSNWKTSSVNKGVRQTTTWWGVTCPAFGPARLFTALDQATCHQWCARVDAARDPSASPPGETSVGEVVAQRLDKVTRSLGQMPLIRVIVLIVATVPAVIAFPQMLMSTTDHVPQAAIAGAIYVAVLALGWRGVGRPWVGIAVAVVAGASLVAKPWIAPVVSEWDGQVHALSPTSETHLYFVLPGLALVVVAVGLISTMKIRTRAGTGAGTGTGHSDAIVLAPPKPAPPKPAPLEPPKPR